MRKTLLPVLLTMLVLSACSERKREQAAGSPAPEIAGGAQIAYGYSYRFSVPGDAVTQVQDRHLAMCDWLGAARCRLQEMHRSDGATTGGSIRFVVASPDARQFGSDLTAPVQAVGGKLTSRDFEAEDISKQIAEAGAKAAEKNTAANRAAVANTRERIDTASIWVYYDGKAPFWEQIDEALSSAGETLTASIATLIYFLVAAAPWAVVFAALFFGIRVISRQLRRRLSGPAA